MKELNDEIKLTLNLMQTDIDDGAHDELQSHLYSLLEIKRNVLQQRLVDRSWLEPAVGADKAKPLTSDKLKEGGWWCADNSEDALKAFKLLGLKDLEYAPWDGSYYACFLHTHGNNLLGRGYEHHTSDLKQIHRIGNEFYWGEK